MKVFLFSATTPEGQKVHDRLEAANLDQARYTLEIRKYSDIEFHSDENAAAIKRAVKSGMNIPELPPHLWTAQDELQSRRRRGVPAKIFWAFQKHAPYFALLALWVGKGIYDGRPYGAFAVGGFIAFPLYCLWFIRLVLPIALFQYILQASVWHDWKQLRRLIRFARGLDRLFTTYIPANELDIREATALAAEGKLDAGLQLVEKYRGHPDMAEHLFLSRLSGIYEAAGQFDQVVTLREEAATKGPGGVGEWLDVAMVRIRRKRDVTGAMAALEKIEGREVPALARAVWFIVEGMIAGEKQDDLKACEHYRAALDKLQTTSGSPLTLAWVAEARARMAISLARLGKKDVAKKILAQERALLEARGEMTLLAECDATVAE